MAMIHQSHCEEKILSQQLIECAEEGSLQQFLRLIEDADCSMTDEWGGTLLHHAVVNARTSAIITRLLDNDVPVDKRSRDGRTCVHECALRGNLLNLKLLKVAGGDIYATDDEKNTCLHFASRNNDGVDIVEYLLDFNISPNARNVEGRTPFHECAFGGNLDSMKLLIRRGADIGVETNNGMTALHYACENVLGYEMIEYLLNEGLSINNRSRDGITPLHSCAFRGNLKIMKLLIRRGADIEVKANDGRTVVHSAACNIGDGVREILEYLDKHRIPLDSMTNNGLQALHFAAGNENGAAVIEYLLERGIDVDVRTKEGFTPLLHCAFRGNQQNLQLLVVYGADLRARADDGRTALHAAVTNEKGVEIIQYLLDEGFDVNEKTEDGKTPFLNCAYLGTISNMKVLLDNGANIRVRDNQGRTAIHSAAGNRKEVKMVDFLIKRGILFNTGIEINSKTCDGATALHIAAGNPAGGPIVECLLENGAGPNEKAPNGRTALHICAARGNLKIMKSLLNNGAHLLSRDKNGSTALHAACFSEDGAEMVDFLIEKGIPVNSTTYKGATPLHFASGNSTGYRTVECLLKNGAALHHRMSNSRTALLSCAFGGSPETMRLLLDHGANIQDRDTNENTALHTATLNERGVEMIDLLIDNGIPVDSVAKDGVTPLYTAAGNHFGYHIVKCLLKHGASPNVKTDLGRTALLSCAFGGNVKIMKLLLKAGSKMDTVTNFGFGALHSAAENEKGGEMIKFLLESGLPVDMRTHWGITPLHLSCKAGILKNIRLLLENGADPYAVDRKGLRPRDYAARSSRNSSESTRLLNEY